MGSRGKRRCIILELIALGVVFIACILLAVLSDFLYRKSDYSEEIKITDVNFANADFINIAEKNIRCGERGVSLIVFENCSNTSVVSDLILNDAEFSEGFRCNKQSEFHGYDDSLIYNVELTTEKPSNQKLCTLFKSDCNLLNSQTNNNRIPRTIASSTIAVTVIFTLVIAFAGYKLHSSRMMYRNVYMECRRLEERNEYLENAKSTAENSVNVIQQSNKSKNEIISNIVHDIRTPVKTIVGLSDLLSVEAENPEKVREYVCKMFSSSQYLLEIVDDVLEAAKITSGKNQLNFKSENIYEIVKSIDNIIRPQMKAKNQRFEIKFSDISHVDVVADRLKIEQILLNLLSNSMKYTPNHGKITMEWKEIKTPYFDCAAYEISVSDNGCGICKEYLEKIFRPFSREDNILNSEIQGTGLGLTIVKNLVELMGGSISVESEQGIFTTFTVQLSLRINSGTNGCHFGSDEIVHRIVTDYDREFECNKLSNALSRSVSNDVLTGMKVLIAEDNKINAEILCEVLERGGASCEVCSNGRLAYDAFVTSEPGRYNLILMDVFMPIMNGYEAAKAIRDSDHLSAANIPIVAMTAGALDRDMQYVLESGMNAYAEKPVNIKTLQGILQSVLCC